MTRTLKGFMNLDYVEVRHTPYVQSARFGRGTDAEVLQTVERLVARAILTRRRPLRGAEVYFLRSVLGISQKVLGARLGYSDVAILKWERNKTKRLDPVNEVAVRALMAGYFGIKLLGTFDALLGEDKPSKHLVLDYEERTQGDGDDESDAA
jgi:DNA-binding transcriptional regulator YiaG